MYFSCFKKQLHIFSGLIPGVFLRLFDSKKCRHIPRGVSWNRPRKASGVSSLPSVFPELAILISNSELNLTSTIFHQGGWRTMCPAAALWPRSGWQSSEVLTWVLCDKGCVQQLLCCVAVFSLQFPWGFAILWHVMDLTICGRKKCVHLCACDAMLCLECVVIVC